MIRMALHLFGYDLRAFLRDRQSRFFTLALPVLFLVIFASVFGAGGSTTTVAGGRISTSVYYVPGIIALGVIAACFGNLVASVTAQRERGVLRFCALTGLVVIVTTRRAPPLDRPAHAGTSWFPGPGWRESTGGRPPGWAEPVRDARSHGPGR
jgi:hypothetical protein